MNSSQNIHSCKIFLIIKNFIQSESCIFLKFLFFNIFLIFVDYSKPTVEFLWPLFVCTFALCTYIKCDVSNSAVVIDKVINVYTPPPPHQIKHDFNSFSVIFFSFVITFFKIFKGGLKHRIWSAPLDPPSKATIWKQFKTQYSSVV